MAGRMTFDIDSEDQFHKRRDELVEQYARWIPAPLDEKVDPSDFATLLDWKWGYHDGQLGRWTRGELSEFLLEWCPRKMVLRPEHYGPLTVAVALAMSFLADKGLLDPRSDPVETLTEHAAALVGPFTEAMDDPANYGMAKSLFAGMGVADPSSLDAEDLERLMADFNAQPLEVRKSITDPALARMGSAAGRVPTPEFGPIRMPSDDAVRESAETSVLYHRLMAISDYFAAPGKPLTDKGNLKLADARALVELLDTGAEDEEVIGDHVWNRRSSTDFPLLDHWQQWARKARVVRTQHKRLVAVDAWRRRLAADPVATLHDAVGILFEYGPLASYVGMGTDMVSLLDVSALPLLLRMAERRAPEEYDDLLGIMLDIAETTGLEEYYPGEASGLLDRLLAVLTRAGVVEQAGETRRQEGFRSVRRGGTVSITPFGAAFAVVEARRQGVGVRLDKDVNELTGDELAGRAQQEEVPVEAWWADVVDWLQARPDQPVALRNLLDALDPTHLYLVLATSPTALQDELTAVVRRLLDPDDEPVSERGAVALTWLVEREPTLAREEFAERVFESALLLLEMLAAEDEVFVLEMLGDDQDRGQREQLLLAVSERGRPNGLRLLEVVGRSHPDKRLSKLARKEAFRLRGKLGSRRGSS